MLVLPSTQEPAIKGGFHSPEKTGSSLRNKHTAGPLVGVGLNVSLGLKLMNLAISTLPCHIMGIKFVYNLAFSDDSNYTDNFESIRWESPEWSKAFLPCGQTLRKALNNLPSLFPGLLWERTLSCP